ncbi:TrmB family transcriptional regulator [Haladaptatus sp. NG-WS-4]
MTADTLREQLIVFGFSEKEIDVYFVALRHGEATAKEISDDSGVSIRYVYDVGERLADRGLVKLNDHASPTTIRALPPNEAIAGLRGKLESLESGLDDLYSATEPKTAQFDIIKSRQTVLKRIRTLIDAADSEVVLSVPATVVPDLRETLTDAVDRDVLVLLLVSGSSMRGTEIMYNQLEGVASAARVWAEDVPVMLSTDITSGLLGLHEILTGSNGDNEAVAVTEQQLAATIAGSFLSNYWPMAEEVFVTDPATLPLTYRNFRHTVLQAVLHRRAGNRIRARIDARNGVEQDETITGEVVDVNQALVLPPTNSFPIENSLIVRTDAGEVSVGGPGSFIEDYEAREVTLLEAE